MKLSHTTKVPVRKALAALRTLDSAKSEENELLFILYRQGYPTVVGPINQPKLSTQIARKSGFHNRIELEKFAHRHGLL